MGFILFILIPAIELMLIIEIGGRIGAGWTVFIIVATGIAGFSLAKNEGLMTLQKIRDSIEAGVVPKNEIVEGMMILVAGAFLLTPGFITDAAGLLVLFPGTRPPLRRLVMYVYRSIQKRRRGGPGPGPFR